MMMMTFINISIVIIIINATMIMNIASVCVIIINSYDICNKH